MFIGTVYPFMRWVQSSMLPEQCIDLPGWGRRPKLARVRHVLNFDPKSEQILHDPEAAALVR